MFSYTNIDQLRDIRNHTPHQQAAFDTFVSHYFGAIQEIDQIHRLRWSTAHRLLTRFSDYVESLGLHMNSEDWWTAFKGVAGAYIDLNLFE